MLQSGRLLDLEFDQGKLVQNHRLDVPSRSTDSRDLEVPKALRQETSYRKP